MSRILSQITDADSNKKIEVLHLAAETMPFLKRYTQHKSLSIKNHCEHLIQLKYIYETFDKSLYLKKILPAELQYLLNRADQIKHDLNYFSTLGISFDSSVKLSATQKYIDYLTTLTDTEMLAHFLCAILGDLNGGRFLKNAVSALTPAGGGIAFYSFEPHALANLEKCLRGIIPFLEKDTSIEADIHRTLGKACIKAFEMQIPIIAELEANQTTIMKKHRSCGFFSCPSPTTIAVAVTVTAASALIAYSRYQPGKS